MPNYKLLRALGLSQEAIVCYENLFEDGAATATQLAERLSLSRTGLYRILWRMEKLGFVTSLKIHLQPTYFDAELLDRALVRYADYQRRAVSELIEEQAKIMTERSGVIMNSSDPSRVRPSYRRQ